MLEALLASRKHKQLPAKTQARCNNGIEAQRVPFVEEVKLESRVPRISVSIPCLHHFALSS